MPGERARPAATSASVPSARSTSEKVVAATSSAISTPVSTIASTSTARSAARSRRRAATGPATSPRRRWPRPRPRRAAARHPAEQPGDRERDPAACSARPRPKGANARRGRARPRHAAIASAATKTNRPAGSAARTHVLRVDDASGEVRRVRGLGVRAHHRVAEQEQHQRRRDDDAERARDADRRRRLGRRDAFAAQRGAIRCESACRLAPTEPFIGASRAPTEAPRAPRRRRCAHTRARPRRAAARASGSG
jgi:hypothetical protein